MMMIDPRRVTVGMQDTFRLQTEEPDIASMRRLDQTMDDILNSHDSPADVMTKYHQALTKYLLFDKKVGQHETIKRTSPPSVDQSYAERQPSHSSSHQSINQSSYRSSRQRRDRSRPSRHPDIDRNHIVHSRPDRNENAHRSTFTPETGRITNGFAEMGNP